MKIDELTNEEIELICNSMIYIMHENKSITYPDKLQSIYNKFYNEGKKRQMKGFS